MSQLAKGLVDQISQVVVFGVAGTVMMLSMYALVAQIFAEEAFFRIKQK